MKKIFVTLIMSGLMASCYANTKELTVYKDANCGCCGAWITYMQNAGYKVTAINSPDMQSIKAKYNIPSQYQSCHTTIVNSTGQVIEGHVPVNAVEKLVKDSSIKGITVPGMKGNSPGMGEMNGQLETLTLNGKPFSKD